MISKLIVWGEDRQKAIDRLYEALNDYKVIGLPTNIKFMKRVLLNDTFKKGVFDTSFIQNNEKELLGDKELSKTELQKQHATIAITNLWFENEKLRLKRKSNVDPWKTYDNFRINHPGRREVKLKSANDKSHRYLVEYSNENTFSVYEELSHDKLEPVILNA